MRLKITSDSNIQVGNAEGVTAYELRAGDTVELPEDIAALALAQGVGEPVKADRATKAAGETATKK